MVDPSAGVNPKSGVLPAVSLAILLAIFFPYVSPVPVPSDTQPLALALCLIAAALVISEDEPVPVQIWLLAIPALGSILLAFAGGFAFDVARNIANYVSLFAISIVSFFVFRQRNVKMGQVLPWVAGVWIAVGVVQLLADRNFGTFLLGHVRTTDIRGATSLAPEPTFFATALLFIFFFAVTAERKNKILISACIVSIVVIAQSAQITLILMAGGTAYAGLALVRRRLRLPGILIGIALLGTGFFFFTLYADSRIIGVFKLIAENPSTLFLVDASANNRASHIYVSFVSSFQNFFLPHGVSREAWVAEFYQTVSRHADIFWFVFPGDQIMSGYGKALFELGFLAFPIILAFNTLLLKVNWVSVELKWSLIVMVNLLMVSAIPLSHPMIPAFIGWIAAQAEGSSEVRTWRSRDQASLRPSVQ